VRLGSGHSDPSFIIIIIIIIIIINIIKFPKGLPQQAEVAQGDPGRLRGP